MPAGNHVSLVGNVTRDPDLRFTPSGKATVSFGLAVNNGYRDKAGKWQEFTEFFDVACWGPLAENVAQSCVKGTRVLVEGSMTQRSWEDAEGAKHRKWEVRADDVGASLKWATAVVTRAERRSPEDTASLHAVS